jgi:hypothetical protein
MEVKKPHFLNFMLNRGYLLGIVRTTRLGLV